MLLFVLLFVFIEQSELVVRAWLAAINRLKCTLALDKLALWLTNYPLTLPTLLSSPLFSTAKSATPAVARQ